MGRLNTNEMSVKKTGSDGVALIQLVRKEGQWEDFEITGMKSHVRINYWLC